MSIQDLIKQLQDMVLIYGDKIILTITDGKTEYRIKDITGKLCAQYFEPSDHVSEVIVRIDKKLHSDESSSDLSEITTGSELQESEVKFEIIVKKLSETMKKYKFDDYDESVKILVKRLDDTLCTKPLKNQYINKWKENITELWAFALQTKDVMEFDYLINNDYYECSYYDGFQAPFTVLQWEGDLNVLNNIVDEWINGLEKLEGEESNG